MLAAGRAAELGARVALFEKGNRLGRKLLISGKGRCNLTNIGDIEDFLARFGETGDFLRNVFSRFFNQDLMILLERYGLQVKVERGGRIFPSTDRADSVSTALTKYLGDNGVKILYNSRVRKILARDKEVYAVELGNGKIVKARKVILATGGRSYPRTGSTGDGYKIAEALGHKITPLTPALIPLLIRESFVEELQGLTLKNANISVFKGGRDTPSEFGEMLFTHFGVSGPIVLSLSGDVAESLGQEKEIILSLDLKPALEKNQIRERIVRDNKIFGRKNFKNYLKEFLPSKMTAVFIKLLRIPGDKKVNQLTQNDREKFIDLLKDFRITAVGTRPMEEAIVTRGGVSVKEIEPKTMESKIIKGLYFSGELIDIDARTGGYNLQAAFSTGYIAGENAAKSRER